MASISPIELAREIRDACLAGRRPEASWVRLLVEQAAAPDPETAEHASQALFRDVVEALADRFEPELCVRYAEFFAQALTHILPELDEHALIERYQRLRQRRPYNPGRPAPERIYVLSRVTLGADIAISSVILDGLKRRFPNADLYFAGPRKNWELFARDRRILHLPVEYSRNGTLRDRVLAGWRLREQFSDPRCLVVDPDSRITQLGLLPICDEDRYFFFETRGYAPESSASLTQLTQYWMAETFGVVDAVPYLAPEEDGAEQARGMVTVSFGVGENPAKAMGTEFEARLLAALVERGLHVLVDLGASPSDRHRAEQAIAASGVDRRHITTWEGSFAPFAARIARSRLYVGYDSAGSHAAAASRVPLVVIFRGHVCERMYQRWQPTGSGPRRVIRVEDEPWQVVLGRTLSYAEEFLTRH